MAGLTMKVTVRLLPSMVRHLEDCPAGLRQYRRYLEMLKPNPATVPRSSARALWLRGEPPPPPPNPPLEFAPLT